MKKQSPLWAITTHFNPVGYKQRLRNYRTFRKRLNVPLVTVELAFDSRPFELRPADAEVLVQIRGGDVMWQKERLLNVAVQSVPAECQAIAWLDCDFFFDDDDWAEKTQEALTTYAVVQPFQTFCEVLPHEPFTHRHGHAAACVLEDRSQAELILSQCGISEKCGVVPGLAWAARRELLESYGLFDRMILGSGDKAFLCAIYGRGKDFIDAYKLPPNLWGEYLDWSEQVHQETAGKVGYIEGNVYHLAHGEVARKKYGNRYDGLKQFMFNPNEDIAIDDCGGWRWNTNKSSMHSFVRDYFASRMEDS